MNYTVAWIRTPGRDPFLFDSMHVLLQKWLGALICDTNSNTTPIAVHTGICKNKVAVRSLGMVKLAMIQQTNGHYARWDSREARFSRR